MQRGVSPRIQELKAWMLSICLLTFPLLKSQAEADAVEQATSGPPMVLILVAIIAAVAIVAGAMVMRKPQAGKSKKKVPAKKRPAGSGKTAPSPLRKSPPSPISPPKNPLTPPPAAFTPAPVAPPTAPPAPTPAAPPSPAPAVSFDSAGLDQALGSLLDDQAVAAPPASAPAAGSVFNAGQLDNALDDLFGDAPAPAAAAPAAPSDSGVFDAGQLDNALDDLFGDAPSAPAPTADSGMFNSGQLDNALDDLFGDTPTGAAVAPPAPEATPPSGGGLFDSDGLDSALDNLFGEDEPVQMPAPTPAPAPAAPGGMFDEGGLDSALDDLFGDAPAAPAPAPAPASGGIFDEGGLDSALDNLFGDSEPSLPTAPPAPAAAATAPSSGSSGMFDAGGLDSALDDLFSEGASTPAAPAPAPGGGMFDEEGLDSALDDLFATEPAAEVGNLGNVSFDDLKTDAPPAAEAPASFSTDSIGSDFLASFRLDDSKSSVPETKRDRPKHTKDGLAPMSKMLVDQSTLEDIIRRAEKLGSKGLTTTQVILAAQGQSFDDLLKEVNEVPGVIGTLIVGNDGLVIANTMPDDIDKEIVGALTSSIYLNLDVQVKQMKRGGMRRLVLQTDMGYTILSTLEMGTLVVFSDTSQDFSLNKLLAAVIAMSGRQ